MLVESFFFIRNRSFLFQQVVYIRVVKVGVTVCMFDYFPNMPCGKATVMLGAQLDAGLHETACSEELTVRNVVIYTDLHVRNLISVENDT